MIRYKSTESILASNTFFLQLSHNFKLTLFLHVRSKCKKFDFFESLFLCACAYERFWWSRAVIPNQGALRRCRIFMSMNAYTIFWNIGIKKVLFKIGSPKMSLMYIFTARYALEPYYWYWFEKSTENRNFKYMTQKLKSDLSS